MCAPRRACMCENDRVPRAEKNTTNRLKWSYLRKRGVIYWKQKKKRCLFLRRFTVLYYMHIYNNVGGRYTYKIREGQNSDGRRGEKGKESKFSRHWIWITGHLSCISFGVVTYRATEEKKTWVFSLAPRNLGRPFALSAEYRRLKTLALCAFTARIFDFLRARWRCVSSARNKVHNNINNFIIVRLIRHCTPSRTRICSTQAIPINSFPFRSVVLL